MSLKSVYDKIEEIASHSARTDKEAIINRYRKDELFKKSIYYALNPFLRFNIADLLFNPQPEKFPEYKNNESIFNMLDYLSAKNGATNAEKEFLEIISSVDEYTLEMVRRIITKDLSCGANIKTFRKFFPEIPIHEVMLCIKDPEDYIKHVNGNISGTSCYSIKKDGVRCWAVHDLKNKTIQYLSRTGKEFPNFSIAFDNDIHKLSNLLIEKYPDKFTNNKIIYDGEVDGGKPGSFQKLMTQVRKLDSVDPQIFKFHIFDIVLENISFLDRYQMMYETILRSGFSKIKLLEHFQVPQWVTNSKDLLTLAQPLIDAGEEGIIVKVNSSFYEFKRSKNWLKIKKFHTLDVKVIGWDYGTGKNSTVVGRLNCELSNGNKFNVGSGFSDDQRIDYMTNTPTIVEVAYQEMTKDGKPRFVTFVRPRDDKFETD
jgi:DNA ligase-1